MKCHMEISCTAMILWALVTQIKQYVNNNVVDKEVTKVSHVNNVMLDMKTGLEETSTNG